MTTEIDTLATALYVRVDDLLKDSPHLAPWRPAVGITPRLSDAELVTLAVMQALLGYTSEARWLRHCHARMTLLDLLAVEPQLTARRPGQTLIGDRHYYGREFERRLAQLDVRLLRPARKGEPERAGAHLFKPLRQLIESVNDTLKGQLDLERHGGRTPGGVAVRILQRLLALTAAIWHNHHTGQPVLRSLTDYDH
ncbi:hypothetical protein [Actinacidiphila glaucinigra]|uniref:hypothetical protein n=1 Tax=Actinacidiphila glaucinigra TaxID=235986 RepID=UPI0036E8BEFF